jgi:hypothetical protein
MNKKQIVVIKLFFSYLNILNYLNFKINFLDKVKYLLIVNFEYLN